VIGIYSKQRATELPLAYVVPAKGYTAGEELEKEISDWLHRKMASYRRLRGDIRFLDEIPRNAAGNPLRRVLVEQAKKGEAEKPVGPRL